ncbi:prolyl oligopeptidase family serine peptidase [Novosphingobium sp.]|uniref:S9 family peptidase n=1 Tax=Novosphingobium sp. TaxID=1874826 RepID=UPI0025FE32EB|nr:prolyl oligopeptidase family serine peptidase [Novosphingobium sp.]
MNKFFGLATRFISILWIATAGANAADRPRREPLPVEIAASVKGHGSNSAITYSPDGQWIAYTVSTPDFLPKASLFFSASGVPFAEGLDRKEAHITNTHTGEEVRLGGSESSSWAPAWSPDGKRVAFYSDDGGQAGLWVWNLATRKAERIPGVVVRPFWGWEVPRWSADGHSLLVKVLPIGETIQHANAMNPLTSTKRQFPLHEANAPGVVVLRTTDQTMSTTPGLPAISNRALADLALVDLKTQSVRRLVQNARLCWYAFSPDERSVAYTEIDAFPLSGPLYSIKVQEVTSGQVRTLGKNVAAYWGTEFSWAPDSQSLAQVDRDEKDAPRVAILPVDGSPLRPLPPVVSVTFLDTAPRWSEDGQHLYASAEAGELWRLDPRSGASQRVAKVPGIEIKTLVSKFDSSVVWTTDRGRALWAIGRRATDRQPYILRIDSGTGSASAEPLPSREIEAMSSIDASDASGEIAFVAKDQQHPADVWVYQTKAKRARQISHLNSDLERYALGQARVIDFRTADGKALQAALLLPPGFRLGRPLPTVVWVYGGQYGSHAVRTFGFDDDTGMFNMHVLATRGYAVLFPDAPITQGAPVKSLLDTVLPAVDAAIAQGFADPDRLAIMGQSYGAYSTLALISHTDRFKAAVTTGNVINPDLLASYLEIDQTNTLAKVDYFEHGQGAMGGSPWQYRDRYLENSPIFSFDKISTPLLMGQGAEDFTSSGADATYIALRRLGKSVEYRIYEGEGHVLQRRADVIDFWNRRLTFLAEHLGKSAVDQ